jgi:hypothetical protein
MVQNDDWKLKLRDAPVVTVAKKSTKKGANASDGEAAAKKEKHTPGLLHAFGMGERRLARAVSQAAVAYTKRSKKAAQSGRDGAVRAVPENLAKALEKGLAQIVKIPSDVTKSREYRKASKQARRNARRIAW